MNTSSAPLPNLALLLGIAAASTLGVSGWSMAARAQTTTAPATTVPPAATPAIPPAAGTTAPPEVPAPGTASAPKPHKGHGQSEHGQGGRGMSGYLSSLHDALAITPPEEPLWNAFADTMRDTSGKLAQAYRQRREQLPTMDALQDMNSFVDIEQMRLDGLKKSSVAFATLYQTMPSDQKKIADKLFLSDMPGAPHHKKPKSG